MKLHTKLTLAMVILATASSIHAASVSINNHSFETGAGLPADPGWNNNTPDGWTRTGGGGMQNSDPDPTGIDGGVYVFLEGGTGTMTQNITASIMGGTVNPGDVFTLTLAADNSNNSPTFDFDIQDGFGGSLIGGAVSSATLTGAFADYDVIGTVDTASSDVVLMFKTNGPQVLVDNVRLDLVQVPEPSSTALLGLGGLALILRRKK